MDSLYLIKIGEINLKDGNQAEFVARLKRDIKRRLRGIPSTLEAKEARYYLSVPAEFDEYAEFALSRTPGVNGWAKARRCAKDMATVRELAIELMREKASAGAKSFKVEARRSDKSFPLGSYDIARELGGAVLEALPELRVDVHAPEALLYVEIREQAYVYTDGQKGVRGLPVGSGGTGLLMLSGGIDSPVAGYRMISRGLALESLYFHSYPYTSQEAWNKVRDLAVVLASFQGGMTMHTASFTELQLKIRKDAPEDRATLYLRACMVMAADMVAKKRGLNCVVSGESLGQVASQTAENMRFTGSYSDFAILRPLAGTDKEDTVRTAREIGSFELSILPYEDCCVLFSPKHPVLKARYESEKAAFDSLGFRELVAASVDAIETIELDYPGPKGLPKAPRR